MIIYSRFLLAASSATERLLGILLHHRAGWKNKQKAESRYFFYWLISKPRYNQ